LTVETPQSVAAVVWKGVTGTGSALVAITVSAQDDILFWLRASSLAAGILVSLAMAGSIVIGKRRKRK